jgi:hypothetical protein
MGTDAKSAAISLGKALNDPKTQLSAMARVGIKFSNSQTEFIKHLVDSGQLQKAQTVILEELQNEFGGVARALAGGTGSFAQAKNAVNDFVQEIGRLFSPEAVAIAQKLGKFSKQISGIETDFLLFKATLFGVIGGTKAAFQSVFDGLSNIILGVGEVIKSQILIFKGEFDLSQVVREVSFDLFRESMRNFMNVNEEFERGFFEQVEATNQRDLEFEMQQDKAAEILARRRNPNLAEEQRKFENSLEEEKEKRIIRNDFLNEEFLELNRLALQKLQIEQKGHEIVLQEHNNRIRLIKNNVHKEQLRMQKGFGNKGLILDKNIQLNLVALHGDWAKTIVKIDQIAGKFRMDIADKTFEVLTNALEFAGIDGTLFIKAWQILHLLIANEIAKARIFDGEERRDYIFGWVIGLILAAIVDINTQLAIAGIVREAAMGTRRRMRFGSSGHAMITKNVNRMTNEGDVRLGEFRKRKKGRKKPFHLTVKVPKTLNQVLDIQRKAA